MELRKLCAEFILIKSDYYAPFLNSPEVIKYYYRISKNGVFGTNIEMHALSWLISRPIIVYSDQPHIPVLTIKAECCLETSEPILLTHQWNNHFNVVKKINEDVVVGIAV